MFTAMMKILFICHGNICRSPMAEFLLRDLVEKSPLRGRIATASAATSSEELGNPVYPPARRKLAENGLACAGKRARLLTAKDYDDYDMLICMDRSNVRNTMRIIGSDPESKVSLLLDHTERKGEEVADPWYTGDFEEAWQDILEGCRGLLDSLTREMR